MYRALSVPGPNRNLRLLDPHPFPPKGGWGSVSATNAYILQSKWQNTLCDLVLMGAIATGRKPDELAEWAANFMLAWADAVRADERVLAKEAEELQSGKEKAAD